MLKGRLLETAWPAALYAIGDVHGCVEELEALEAMIVADAAEIAGDKWLLTLGDHIDRGPNSAAVIERMLSPPPAGFMRRALRGNHEQMLLDFLGDPLRHEYWLMEGGLETLASYGIPLEGFAAGLSAPEVLGAIRAGIPAAHLDFIAALPLMLALPGFVFVHAGLRPGVALDRQTDEDLLWIREPFLSAPPTSGLRIVHGHTPSRAPVVTAARIGIDTRCFATGRLTALRVLADRSTTLLSVG
jgi:serine/threonine protein phosphatase 1